MSIHEDITFLRQVSNKLELFKQASKDSFQFRCVYCGDSRKNKFKTRGTLYKSKDGNGLVYGCFNQCNPPVSFLKFLEHTDPLVAKDYKVRRFKNKGQPETFESLVDVCEEIVEVPDLFGLTSLFPINSSTKATDYLKSRLVTDFKNVYFIKNAYEIINKYRPETKRIEEWKDKEAIVFPLMSGGDAIFGFQMRFLEGDFRYMTIMVDRRFPKLWGANNVRRPHDIWVTEGIFDAMMLKNSVANLDASLHTISDKLKLPKSSFILVYDNEPRNREVMKNMKAGVEGGYNVFFWPNDAIDHGKDLNDIRKENPQYFNRLNANMKAHVKTGLQAKLEFSKFVKV